MTKGLICIDIDGTLTPVREQVAQVVVEYLEGLVKTGYQLLFVTGRTHSWSVHLLKTLPFSYILASLNGAYIALMPENQTLLTHYIAFSKLSRIEPLVAKEEVALIICTGLDQDEKSFLYDRYADNALITHLEARKRALNENWVRSQDLHALQIEQCAALRIFCRRDTAPKLHKSLSTLSGVQVAMMKDSYDDQFSVVTVTDSGASKGLAALSVAEYIGNNGPIIACGDDYNDIPMLKIADCKVVMNTAPDDLQKLADIICPSAAENGLIYGLQEALKRF